MMRSNSILMELVPESMMFLVQEAMTRQHSLTAVSVVEAILGLVLLALSLVWWKRRCTYRALAVHAGLPTVFWRPKFVRYHHQDDDGNAKKLAATSITNILPRMQRLQGPYQMYGTVYGVSTAVVHVAHPIPALAVLSSDSTTSASSCKAPAYNHFKNFCGDGVFTAEGEDWRRKRAAVLHALMRSGTSSSLFDRVQGEAECAVHKLMHELDRRIRLGDSNSNNSEVYARIPNMVPLLQRTTIGLIYRFLTHRDLAALETKEEQEHDIGTVATSTVGDDDGDGDSEGGGEDFTLLNKEENEKDDNESPPPSLISSYLAAITRIRMIILAQSRSIWFLLPRWCYTTFASLYRTEEETMEPIREVAAQAIQRAAPQSPLRLLQQLPLYQNNGASFSKNLMDEAITLLFAGQDTSAATLSWTLHLLTVYPAIQARLADEVCREMRGERSVTKKMISRMPYLDAVIKEAMRLYPVAPFVVRKVGKNMRVAGGGADADGAEKRKSALPSIVFPEGSLACIWIYSLHRNPDFWERPNDFWPERWLHEGGGEKSDKGVTTPGAYMPFAAGARNCVGQPLANVILRTLLVRLVHRYEFRDEHVAVATMADEAGDKDPNAKFRKEMQAGFTVLPQGGLPLEVKLRTHKKCGSM